MKTRVGASGVLIPRDLLGDVHEVEIRKENGVIVVVPIVADDPIWNLGTQPITTDVSDASVNTDRYLYGS